MKKVLVVFASLLAVNVNACELGDICVGNPDISINLPSNYNEVNLECHVWSYYSGRRVDMVALPGDNLAFKSVRLNSVSWAGKDLVMSVKYIDSSRPGVLKFTNVSNNNYYNVITSQCYILPDSIKA